MTLQPNYVGNTCAGRRCRVIASLELGLFVESRQVLPTAHAFGTSVGGMIPFEFCGIAKLESLGYRMALFA